MASVCIWANDLQNNRLMIHANNEALEAIINKSTSKHSVIMPLVRQLVATYTQYNIHIRVKHIPWKFNTTSDLPSRSQIEQFRKEATRANEQPTVLLQHTQSSRWFQGTTTLIKLYFVQVVQYNSVTHNITQHNTTQHNKYSKHGEICCIIAVSSTVILY